MAARAPSAATSIATITSRPMSPTSPPSSTWTRSATAGVKIGIDPLGRRGGALLAADHRALRPRRHPRQRCRRSDVPLHDGGLGRQNSHGLLVALCDGAADRDARAVRRRLCQRHRRRPPRHRDALQRPDEPEPLPGRRDRLSVRASAAMAPGQRGRQDHRLQRDHRPRRGQARAQAGRDAGRVQMVRRRADRRFVRLRRRGKRRRLVPAAGRVGVDHRQGRHHPGAAGRRDDRADPTRSGPVVQCPDRRTRRALSTSGSTRRRRRSRRICSRRSRPRSWG